MAYQNVVLPGLGRRSFLNNFHLSSPATRETVRFSSSARASPTYNLNNDPLQPPASRKAMAARLALLENFVENDCIPAEPVFALEMDEIESRTGSRWKEIPLVLTSLKSKARSLGLWNLFMPKVLLYVCTLWYTCSSLQQELPVSSLQSRGEWGSHCSQYFYWSDQVSSISYVFPDTRYIANPTSMIPGFTSRVTNDTRVQGYRSGCKYTTPTADETAKNGIVLSLRAAVLPVVCTYASLFSISFHIILPESTAILRML